MKNFIFLILLIILILPVGMMPQESSDSEQQKTAEKTAAESPKNFPEILPIPPSEIPKMSVETIAQLDSIRDKIKPLDDQKNIEQNFQDLQKEIDWMERELSEMALEHLKFSRLAEFKTDWENAKTQTTAWQSSLQSRSKELETFGQTLKEQEHLWALTEKASLERGDPQALRARIREILESIADLDKDLKIRQEAVLTLMDQISQDSMRSTKALAKLSEAQSQTRKKILAVDSPPIWKAFERTEEKTPLSRQMNQTIASRKSLFDKFIQTNWPRIIFHLALFIIIALALRNFRRRGDSWIEQNALECRYKYIFRYPFSSSLLLSLLFTSFIYPYPPEFIRELNLLLFLIPLIRLLPKIIHKEMRAPLFGLAGLYVLQRMDELIIDFLWAHRLMLLLISLLGFVGLFWILRSKRSVAQLRSGQWGPALIFLSRIALILLAVSILGNIFGNVSLADLLTNAILNIAYVGVALFAAVLILESVIVLSFQSRFLSKLRIIQKHPQLIRKRVGSWLHLLALFLWILFSLSSLEIFDPLKEATLNILSRSWQVGNFSFTLGDVLIFAVTIWLSIKISRLIRFILEEDVLPRIPLPRGVPTSISMLTNYVILAIGFLIALTAAGMEWSKFALLAGAFGVGIGFGLQNVVNNFISGLILIFERPIKVGDTIEVGALKGTVKRIGIRSSTIRTFEGAEVIVPNGTIIQSEVTNWTLSDQLRRIDVNVGVAYGTDPNEVLLILQKVAKDHPVVLDNPAPMVLFLGFGESSLDFSLRIWTSDFANWISFSSEITLQVHNALKKARIEIPFPQRDLHLRSVVKDIPPLVNAPQKKRQGKDKTSDSPKETAE